MSAPRPSAVRLYTSASGASFVRPPFGLASWSDEAATIVVLIELTASGIDAAAIAAQLPDPSSMGADGLVIVLGTAARRGGRWRRWLGERGSALARRARCGALLARGYVGIGAGATAEGDDLAWGRVS